MRILAFKPGHDGSVAYLDGNSLRALLEPEKDSFPRFHHLTPSLVLQAAAHFEEIPDVVAIGGWHRLSFTGVMSVGAGYSGLEPVLDGRQRFFGKEVRWFSSTHDRSHLLCAYGLSPWPQGEPCYALLWEGDAGAFYRIGEDLEIEELGRVVDKPGRRYVHPYELADPGFPVFDWGDTIAGKMMALAAFGAPGKPSREELELIELFLDGPFEAIPAKSRIRSELRDAGVESAAFKSFARKFSDALFERFFDYAEKNLNEGLPLLIAGGCGLNCDWNSRLRESGLFADVFVPPCVNDSGSALGTAIDALHHYTGRAKIEWDVYAGEDFVNDSPPPGIDCRPAGPAAVADLLASGQVIAWVQGRCEMGPRALGNRSLLAAPFDTRVRDRLNAIKQREPYRPVAPVCLQEDVSEHFAWEGPSPFMLYVAEVKDPRLQAITHVDGSARIQTVEESENPPLHRLLVDFRERAGAGVLCNTSLNFSGRGFINHLSHLSKYCLEQGIDAWVVGDRIYRPAGTS